MVVGPSSSVLACSASRGLYNLKEGFRQYNRPINLIKTYEVSGVQGMRFVDMGQGDDFLEASKKGGDIAVPGNVATTEEMDTFDVVPALESEEVGGEVAENLQHGSSDDGRQVATAAGVETPGDGMTSAGQETPPAADLLRRRRDEAIQTFTAVERAFNSKLLEGKFKDSLEVLAAREVVGEKFDHLCNTNGELAAATGGHWFDIATYKPVTMGHQKALRKKQEAVSRSRTAFKLAEAQAAANRARMAAEKVARQAIESA